MLTEQDIVDRAEQRMTRFLIDRKLPLRSAADRQADRFYAWTFRSAMAFGLLLALYAPIHSWLHAHVEFLWGVLMGSLLQSLPWLRDRWLWLKLFSHQ